jgi:hypothetical protein
MASPNDFPSGLNLAGTVFANGRATLQLGGRVYLSGLVQWLDTIGGNNANPGNKPELPVQTLAQAVTNSAANGVIVIGAGSSEDLVASQALSLDNLSIFGCGTGSSRPRYRCTGAVAMFNGAGTGGWIENIYFPASTAVPTCRVDLAGPYWMVKDCYFECGANDTTRALRIGAAGTGSRVDGCSFVVTASRPAIGLEIAGASTNQWIEGCTFDGGSYGFTDYALKVSAAATGVRQIGNTFINRADLGHTVTATTYQIYGNNVGGTGNVLLTA